MSVKRRGIWCVEVLFKKNDHELVVFDNAEDAEELLNELQHNRFYCGMRVRGADMWEM